MKYFLTLGFLAMLVVSCAAAPKLQFPSASSDAEREVLAEMARFYDKHFLHLDYEGMHEFYTPDAVIDSEYRRPIDPLELERIKKYQYKKMRANGVYYRITIEKIKTLTPDLVFVRCKHKVVFRNNMSGENIRLFIWVRTQAGWKIIWHAPYLPDEGDQDIIPALLKSYYS